MLCKNNHCYADLLLQATLSKATEVKSFVTSTQKQNKTQSKQQPKL